MIESIGNFRTSLRSGYKAIYEVLNKLRVGNNNFQTIISEHLISDENSKPLDLVQSHDEASLPLRIQLKDISGIAANAFGYYVAGVWASGALGQWNQILVLPVTELVEADVIVNIRKVCREYLGDDLIESIIDESFFKNTLFIISGCNELSIQAVSNFEALAAKDCNILVLSEATKKHTCLTNSGYTVYKIGLMAPQGILKFDDEKTVLINGLEILDIEKQVRSFGFRTDLKSGSIIDNISNPVLDFSSSRIVLRGREHKVQHNIKFIINFEELTQKLHGIIFENKAIDSITNRYMAIAPNTAKDWFAAATTSDADDIGVIQTYNIAGRIITRNLKNNYLSYGGRVKDVMGNIIGKITSTLTEEYKKIEEVGVKKVIPQDRWLTIVTDKVRAELYKNSYIDVRRLNSADEHGGILTTVDLNKPDILSNDGIQDPSYSELDRRLKTKGHLDFNKMIRMILENRTNESSDIPEELYVLTACFFIAETNRNPATFLPSLMLLDLAQKGYDNDIIGWDWDSIISQESMLNSVLYNPFGVISRSYGDFRGMHPMTHDGSYFQSQNICNIPFEKRSRILSLVEYKSSVIILDWLALSCMIKPMEGKFKDLYSAEIFPRFTGRFSKTNVIDENIDISYCLESEETKLKAPINNNSNSDSDSSWFTPKVLTLAGCLGIGAYILYKLFNYSTSDSSALVSDSSMDTSVIGDVLDSVSEWEGTS